MGRCQASNGLSGEQCRNWRADSDFCHWHADQNPTGQTPRGDVRVTRRSSKAESYETFDPKDPKMAALRERTSSGLPPLPTISSPRALVLTASDSRPLTSEERQQAVALRQAQMLDRHQAMRDRAALLETEMAERARAKGKMRNGYSHQPHQIYNSSSQNVFSDANSKQRIQAEETIEGKSDLPQVQEAMHGPPLQYTAPPAIPPAIPESQAVMQDSFKAPPMPQRHSFPAFPRSSRDSGFGARSDSTTSSLPQSVSGFSAPSHSIKGPDFKRSIESRFAGGRSREERFPGHRFESGSARSYPAASPHFSQDQSRPSSAQSYGSDPSSPAVDGGYDLAQLQRENSMLRQELEDTNRYKYAGQNQEPQVMQDNYRDGSPEREEALAKVNQLRQQLKHLRTRDARVLVEE